MGHSLAALAAIAGAPLAGAALALRPAWRVGWRERLGGGPAAPSGAAPVWIHGASVGEARVVLRLVDALRGEGQEVVASTSTATGRALLREERPELVCGLAPLDHPWLVARALGRMAPSLLVLVETELWPCWIQAAAARGIPVVVVSARISDRSWPRYRRGFRLLAPTLGRLAAVGARSSVDGERFEQLGVAAERVSVTGDLKLEPPARVPRLAPELAAALEGPPLFVAGSTHEGEEQAALGALAEVEAAGQRPALLLAPRHPQRNARVAQVVRAAGRTLRLRSELPGAPLAAGEVLLLDTLGELAAVYSAAEVAFVGGSLVPVGGHNLLEPIQSGRAVLFGPHTQNARSAAALVLENGWGQRVDAAGLGQAVGEALAAPDAWRERGTRARAGLAVHAGSTERTTQLLRRFLKAP